MELKIAFTYVVSKEHQFTGGWLQIASVTGNGPWSECLLLLCRF